MGCRECERKQKQIERLLDEKYALVDRLLKLHAHVVQLAKHGDDGQR